MNAKRQNARPTLGFLATNIQGDVSGEIWTGIVDAVDGETCQDAEHAPNHNKTAQAARLKETRTIVTGISEAVAETIVDL